MLIEDEPGTLLTYKTLLATEGYNMDAFLDSYEVLTQPTTPSTPGP